MTTTPDSLRSDSFLSTLASLNTTTCNSSAVTRPENCAVFSLLTFNNNPQSLNAVQADLETIEEHITSWHPANDLGNPYTACGSASRKRRDELFSQKIVLQNESDAIFHRKMEEFLRECGGDKSTMSAGATSRVSSAGQFLSATTAGVRLDWVLECPWCPNHESIRHTSVTPMNETRR